MTELSFHIAPDDLKRLRKSVFGQELPRAYYLVLIGIWVAQAIMKNIDHRTSFWFVVGLMCCAGGILLAIASYRTARGRGIAIDGSLELTAAGFAGTLDATPVTIPWSAIVSVRDIGDAFAIYRRARGAPVIVIPKAGVADPATFWAICEEHLIAKRGLISTARPRTTIVNTVSA